MKRKRSERPERRRSMPEIDLSDEHKARVPGIPKLSRRGCTQLFGQVLALIAVVMAVIVGLR